MVDVYATLHEEKIITSSEIARKEGLSILKNGGNAFDAAVAVGALLTVIEPHRSVLGGGGFWLLYHSKEKQYQIIDAREQAPLRSHHRMFVLDNHRLNEDAAINGPLASGIPGLVSALEYITKHYGHLKLETTLAPAIKYANEGFAVTDSYIKAIQSRINAIQSFPQSAEIFLDHGQIPKVGFHVIQKDLARTLDMIAREGAQAFYQGQIADLMVASINHYHGIWRKLDLQNYQPVLRQPLVSTYKRVKVITAPPPLSDGITVLTMLNVLSEMDVVNHNLADRIHLMIASMHQAYHEKFLYLADPSFMKVPPSHLISKAHGKHVAMNIQLNKVANPPIVKADESTLIHSTETGTYLPNSYSIIDKDGNVVVAIFTDHFPFGSGFVAENTGVLLNNAMHQFALDQNRTYAPSVYTGIANNIAANKRPVSLGAPVILQTDDQITVVKQPLDHDPMKIVIAILEFAEKQTLFPPFHYVFSTHEILYEPQSFDKNVSAALNQKGYILKKSTQPYNRIAWYSLNKDFNVG